MAHLQRFLGHGERLSDVEMAYFNLFVMTVINGRTVLWLKPSHFEPTDLRAPTKL